MTSATQLLALLKDGQCTERYEFNLTTEDIQSRWATVTKAVLLAADTLRKNMGVVNARYLPYEALLTLLAYYYAKSGKRSLSAKDMTWVSRWFWRSSLGKRYGTGGPTRMGQDRALFDLLMDGQEPQLDHPLHLTEANLVKTRMTQTGAAVRNAFLCLLAIREPQHLVNNSKLELVNGGISDFTDAEKHHVFPKAYLSRNGPVQADIHSVPNFCFLPAELNKRILDKDPATYFTELRAENPRFEEAAKSHLLPTGPGSGIAENDYLKFLNARATLILEEIKRLCGDVTSPRESERQTAVQELEVELRDLIHGMLADRHGENYWKTNIPPDVRDNAEKRLKEALAKSPDMRLEEFKSIRRRLDYCNVMDYLTIIENGGNWPAFAGIFHKKLDLQRYLSSFSEYRNALMHNREMSELVETNGKAALIWFANVLPEEAEAEDQEEGEDE